MVLWNFFIGWVCGINSVLLAWQSRLLWLSYKEWRASCVRLRALDSPPSTEPVLDEEASFYADPRCPDCSGMGTVTQGVPDYLGGYRWCRCAYTKATAAQAAGDARPVRWS